MNKITELKRKASLFDICKYKCNNGDAYLEGLIDMITINGVQVYFHDSDHRVIQQFVKWCNVLEIIKTK